MLTVRLFIEVEHPRRGITASRLGKQGLSCQDKSLTMAQDMIVSGPTFFDRLVHTLYGCVNCAAAVLGIRFPFCLLLEKVSQSIMVTVLPQLGVGFEIAQCGGSL